MIATHWKYLQVNGVPLMLLKDWVGAWFRRRQAPAVKTPLTLAHYRNVTPDGRLTVFGFDVDPFGGHDFYHLQDLLAGLLVELYPNGFDPSMVRPGFPHLLIHHARSGGLLFNDEVGSQFEPVDNVFVTLEGWFEVRGWPMPIRIIIMDVDDSQPVSPDQFIIAFGSDDPEPHETDYVCIPLPE